MKINDRAGLLYALAGFIVLSLGDIIVKSMAGQWAPSAVASLRYVLGVAGLGALVLARRGRSGFAMPHPRIQVLRGLGVAIATISFFSALFVMPLATATTITFISPMITALLAALLLGEPARRETWIATVVAFVGVVIVLRPNFAAVGWEALLPLVAAVGMGMLMIGNRFVAGTGSALSMQFFVALCAAPFLLLATLVGHTSCWARFVVDWPEWSVVLRCGLVAISASCAHWLIYMGTTRAGAATIAPMTYVQLLVATLAGWAIFGDHPDALTLLGAAVIVGAGVYLWRTDTARAVT